MPALQLSRISVPSINSVSVQGCAVGTVTVPNFQAKVLPTMATGVMPTQANLSADGEMMGDSVKESPR
jgi:hypothetical protein